MKEMRADMGRVSAKNSSWLNSILQYRWCRCRRCIYTGHRATQATVRCLGTRQLTALDYFARINIIALTPLCENLPGPSANKPGDVLVAFHLY